MDQLLFHKELKNLHPVSKMIENLEIDCSIDMNYITINSNQAFTFKNQTVGLLTTVVITNSSEVNVFPSFQGVFQNSLETGYMVEAGKINTYIVTQKDTIPILSLLSSKNGTPFLEGALGDLLITSGQTVTITAGSLYDYDNIDIQAGGTLVVNETTSPPRLTQICASTFKIDGSIQARSLYLQASSSQPLSTIFGYPLQTQYYLASCGNGGRGGSDDGASGGYGGTSTIPSAFGGAGGGGGAEYYFSLSQTTTNYNGGNGGSDGASGAGGSGSSGGSGSNYYANNASIQTGASGGSGGGGGGYKTSTLRGGGGGAGSYRNKCGLPLYLYCTDTISGNGLVDCSGVAGLRGGNGANGSSGSGGGGGGGGAGGCGGHLAVTSAIFTVPYTVSGGAGGAGGSGGSGAGTASNGSSGSSGVDGTFTII